MSDYAIGIDLGTSTSEICVFRNNEPFPIPDTHPQNRTPITPSLVAFKRNGETAVGEAARTLAYSERGVLEVKRKMGTDESVSALVDENNLKTFRPEEISALILQKLKGTAEGSLNTTIKDIVLTVPANFSDAARQATKHAAEIAGLNVLRLINEPTAAALAFGINNLDIEEQMIVFDFGGGTLDITILEMFDGVLDVKCSFGDRYLGGKDIDDALIVLVAEKFKRKYPRFVLSQRDRDFLKRPCELAKMELSTQTSTQLFFPNFYSDGGVEVDLEIDVTRTEFESAIEPLLEKARSCIRETLKAKEIRPSSINRILLVGGTTYIPAVRRLVKEMFGKEPSEGVNPDLAVAMGASIQAALIMGQIDEDKGIILTDVCPYSLGIDIITPYGYEEVLVFMPLIERNTKIPFSRRYEDLKLRYIDQEVLEFKVYQDHTGKARFPHECEDTDKGGAIKNIPKATNGEPHQIVIDFAYDLDGIAVIKASIPATGNTITISHGASSKRMNEHDIAFAKNNVSDLWKKNTKAKNFEDLIEKAERMVNSLSSSDSVRLNNAIVVLKQALTASDNDHIENAGNNLIDLMYDMESA